MEGQLVVLGDILCKAQQLVGLIDILDHGIAGGRLQDADAGAQLRNALVSRPSQGSKQRAKLLMLLVGASKQIGFTFWQYCSSEIWMVSWFKLCMTSAPHNTEFRTVARAKIPTAELEVLGEQGSVHRWPDCGQRPSGP